MNLHLQSNLQIRTNNVDLSTVKYSCRFQTLMQDKDLILAAAVNPLCLRIYPEELKEYGVSNLQNLRNYCDQEEALDMRDSPDFFASPSRSNTATTHDCGYLKFFSTDSNNMDISAVHQYACVKDVFLRLNTPLPSSATIERVFSEAKRVMSYQRSQLSDKYFEKTLILTIGVRSFE